MTRYTREAHAAHAAAERRQDLIDAQRRAARRAPLIVQRLAQLLALAGIVAASYLLVIVVPVLVWQVKP